MIGNIIFVTGQAVHGGISGRSTSRYYLRSHAASQNISGTDNKINSSKVDSNSSSNLRGNLGTNAQSQNDVQYDALHNSIFMSNPRKRYFSKRRR